MKKNKTNPDAKPVEAVAVPPKSMLLLPPNLAALAKLAAKDIGKYSMTCVKLEATADGYKATATDGKFLGHVEGISEDAALYPETPAMRGAPGGATEAMIPQDTWVEALKLIPKAAITKAKPILGHAVAKMAPNETTFAATDLEKARSVMTRHVEGRFPAYQDIVSPKSRPLAVVKVDAERLVDLLNVAKQYSLDSGANAVTLEIHGGNLPMMVKSQSGSQKFTGILMPLGDDHAANGLSASVMTLRAVVEKSLERLETLATMSPQDLGAWKDDLHAALKLGEKPC